MNIILTSRDIRILQFLKVYSCATRIQLERILNWHCTSRINRRLRKLVEYGYLDRKFMPTTVGAPPAVYFLGAMGVKELSGQSDPDLKKLQRQRRRARAMSMNSIPHTLGVTEIASAFIAHCEQNPHCKWFDWKTEDELRTLCNPEGYSMSDRLVPDGYGKYSVDKQRFNFFLELDCGTEPVKRILKKLDFYQSLVDSGTFRRAFGFRQFALLIVTTTEGRCKSLTKHLPMPSDYVLRIGFMDLVIADPLFGFCWLKPSTEDLTALHKTLKVEIVRSV